MRRYIGSPRAFAVLSDTSARHNLFAGERRQIAERPDARQEKVGSAPRRGEGWQADDLSLDRPLGDREVVAAVLGANERIALVAELVELWVVDPDVLEELELAHEACTADEGR